MPPGCGDGGGEGSSVIETRRHQVIGAAGDGDGAREEAVKGRGVLFRITQHQHQHHRDRFS